MFLSQDIVTGSQRQYMFHINLVCKSVIFTIFLKFVTLCACAELTHLWQGPYINGKCSSAVVHVGFSFRCRFQNTRSFSMRMGQSLPGRVLLMFVCCFIKHLENVRLSCESHFNIHNACTSTLCVLFSYQNIGICAHFSSALFKWHFPLSFLTQTVALLNVSFN